MLPASSCTHRAYLTIPWTVDFTNFSAIGCVQGWWKNQPHMLFWLQPLYQWKRDKELFIHQACFIILWWLSLFKEQQTQHTRYTTFLMWIVSQFYSVISFAFFKFCSFHLFLCRLIDKLWWRRLSTEPAPPHMPKCWTQSTYAKITWIWKLTTSHMKKKKKKQSAPLLFPLSVKTDEAP